MSASVSSSYGLPPHDLGEGSSNLHFLPAYSMKCGDWARAQNDNRFLPSHELAIYAALDPSRACLCLATWEKTWGFRMEIGFENFNNVSMVVLRDGNILVQISYMNAPIFKRQYAPGSPYWVEVSDFTKNQVASKLGAVRMVVEGMHDTEQLFTNIVNTFPHFARRWFLPDVVNPAILYIPFLHIDQECIKFIPSTSTPIHAGFNQQVGYPTYRGAAPAPRKRKVAVQPKLTPFKEETPQSERGPSPTPQLTATQDSSPDDYQLSKATLTPTSNRRLTFPPSAERSTTCFTNPNTPPESPLQLKLGSPFKLQETGKKRFAAADFDVVSEGPSIFRPLPKKPCNAFSRK